MRRCNMAVDDGMTAAIRQARDYAKTAETSSKLDDVQEYGGRARTTLESVDRSDLDERIRDAIQQAIRHGTNAQNALSPEAGQFEARQLRELMSNILGDQA